MQLVCMFVYMVFIIYIVLLNTIQYKYAYYASFLGKETDSGGWRQRMRTNTYNLTQLPRTTQEMQAGI